MKNTGIKWIGQIPEHWETHKIGQLFNLRNEKVSDKDYQPLSVSKGGVVPQMESVAKSDASDDRKLVVAGDFAINSRSDRKQSCGVSPLDGSVSLINIVLYPKNKKTIYTNYLNFLLKNYGFAEEFYRWGHGIVADLWTTRWQEMRNIILPLPNALSQHAINEFLNDKCSCINSLIDLQNKQISSLEEFKKTIITETITKGLEKEINLRESGINWIGKIPCDWSVDRIKSRVETRFGGCWGQDSFSDETPHGRICIRIADFNFENQSADNAKTIRYYSDSQIERGKLKTGDIILEKSGGGEKTPVGRTVVFNPESYSHKEVLFANFCECLRPKNVNSRYFAYCLKAFYLNQDMHLFFNQTTGIQNLNVQSVLDEMMVFPSISEQDKLAKYLDSKCREIDDLIAIKQRKISCLNEYKSSLIYEYVTGKKEVAA